MITRSLESIAAMCGGRLLSGGDTLCKGVSIDTRTLSPENLYIPIKGERVDGHSYIKAAAETGAAAALWDQSVPLPEISLPLILVDDTVAALGKLAKSYRNELSATFIGITGSNGKTSTKDMLAGILSYKYKTGKTGGNFNNHIGLPLTILSLSDDTEMAVIELGMSDFGEIDYLADIVQPDIGMIISVGEAHLDALGTVENVAKAKCEIIKHIKPDGLFIYNSDQTVLTAQVAKSDVKVAAETFGVHSGATVMLDGLDSDENGIRFSVTGKITGAFSLPTLGAHQALNCMAAMLAAIKIGFTADEIKSGLKLIENTKMRNEIMRIGSTTVINDSYKSNPASMRAALDTLYGYEGNHRLCVMGDMNDLGENSDELHREISMCLDPQYLDAFYTLGNSCRLTSLAAADKLGDVDIRHFNGRDELAKAVSDYIKSNEGCVVLFKASRSHKFEEILSKTAEIFNSAE